MKGVEAGCQRDLLANFLRSRAGAGFARRMSAGLGRHRRIRMWLRDIQLACGAAANNWLVSYKNLSGLTAEQQTPSAPFPQVAFASRQFYTNGAHHGNQTTSGAQRHRRGRHPARWPMHPVERDHNERFMALMGIYMPLWKQYISCRKAAAGQYRSVTPLP